MVVGVATDDDGDDVEIGEVRRVFVRAFIGCCDVVFVNVVVNFDADADIEGDI